MPRLSPNVARIALSSLRAPPRPIPRAAIAFARPAATTLAITLPFSWFAKEKPLHESHLPTEQETTADMSDKVQKTDSEWIAQLSPEQFRVLRQGGTERPGSSPLDKKFDAGTYHCAGCDAPLYTSKTKFNSGCGWPAFYDTVPGAVVRHEDNSLGMTRTEIVCAKCGGHLGHVFKGEGFNNPIDERHCVNGISLNFKEEEKK
ncbi:peptide-methionine (R)-S-oxide reductase family protein [Vanrija pseudolonga]|uniref:Peptide-methionine (R)-S-oxide reductase n=1 Tax=Vanrija pseudolonga TaxID=143232 RepID=A0AAF0YAN9_9TREE|nr:Peptide methionine sulfoxide reductase B3, chloroplastic [Vanrija pseudolonga]